MGSEARLGGVAAVTPQRLVPVGWGSKAEHTTSNARGGSCPAAVDRTAPPLVPCQASWCHPPASPSTRPTHTRPHLLTNSSYPPSTHNPNTHASPPADQLLRRLVRHLGRATGPGVGNVLLEQLGGHRLQARAAAGSVAAALRGNKVVVVAGLEMDRITVQP